MKSGVSEGKATNPPISIISIISGPQTIEIIEILVVRGAKPPTPGFEIIEMGPISIISIILGPQTIEIIEMGPISIISIISAPQTIEIIEIIEMGPISIISIISIN